MNRRFSLLIGAARRYRAPLLGLALLAGLLVPAASACQVCIPMPVKTLADRLLEADALVLAREDPARPFHYVVREVLKGDPGDAPIDDFLPSADRRVLAQIPQRHMLLARAKPDGGWSALGIADTRLHELAYLEIARAPYSEIRRIASEVPIKTVRGMLDQPRYLEWRSLAILMLAQSGRPADRERIRTTFDDKQRLGSTINLAAWATAYLAIEGTRGVERMQRWYLTAPGRSREELQEIVKAWSVSAAADATLRAPVAAAYRALLERHPSLAPDVARDLIAWRRWHFVEQIRGIRTALAEQDPLGAYELGLYLRSAAGAAPSDAALPSIVETGQPPLGVER
jgi:hypothetical protein